MVDRGTKNEIFEFDGNIIRLNLSLFDSISQVQSTEKVKKQTNNYWPFFYHQRCPIRLSQ